MQYLHTPRYNWRMLQDCSKFRSRNVRTFGFVYHDTNGLNHGLVWKTESFLLNEICTVILWQDNYGKGNLRKSYWNTVGRKFPIREHFIGARLGKKSTLGMLVRTLWKNIFLFVYVDDIKLAGKKQNTDPIWNVLMKQVDFGEPTSFLDHVYFGCTQREYGTSRDIVDNKRNTFESRIFAGATEKTLGSEKSGANIFAFSFDMQGHAKKCVERYCELANKTTQQLYTVSTPCIHNHQFKEEELKSVGELSKLCSQIVVKCLYLAYIGWPDILWSVNKLAPPVKKWTRACDKRLAHLISYMHFTSEFKQYCHMENTGEQCRLGLFHDSDFVGDLEDSKSTWGGILCMLGSHTYVPISLMCKKQTCVSHSSTEAEITSLDAGLRMDGIPALDLWNLVVEVLHYSTNQVQRNQERARGDLQHTKPSSRQINTQTKTRILSEDLELSNVDFVSLNVKSSRAETIL